MAQQFEVCTVHVQRSKSCMHVRVRHRASIVIVHVWKWKVCIRDLAGQKKDAKVSSITTTAAQRCRQIAPGQVHVCGRPIT